MSVPAPDTRLPMLLTHQDMGHGAAGHSGHGGGAPAAQAGHGGHAGHAAASDTSGIVHVPPVDAPAGTRVLSYLDLERVDRSYRLAPPGRTIELRLTGNMEKFIWSFDDKKYSERPVVDFSEGETVRLVFKNETMMNHPLHLHGLWMDLDNGKGDARPRKHVVIVPPGRTVSVDVQMTEVGRWPFHCHLLFHMNAGMFREFVVHPKGHAVPTSSAPAAGGGHVHKH
jgi:FtsP/CotA-like multicopper oxidase with cupredoxin domain